MLIKIVKKTPCSVLLIIAVCFVLNGCGSSVDKAVITVSTPVIVITPESDVVASISNNSISILSQNMPAVSGSPNVSVSQSTTTNQDVSDNRMISANKMIEDPKLSEGPDLVVYKDGFSYEPLSPAVKQRITGISYPAGCIVPYEDLRYLSVKYISFDGSIYTGELICNKAIADSLMEIFYELYAANYPIGKMKLIDEYGGDDTLSMYDNNTSCFNYRVVEGTDHLSKHALGLAIDINPYYNPYVTYPGGIMRVSPEPSATYADRTTEFPGKISHEDLCYQLFHEHGFTWGGDWKTLKDYQHFQISK